jgi:DNA-directed RNA polymerase subunit RPC12/RpoP
MDSRNRHARLRRNTPCHFTLLHREARMAAHAVEKAQETGDFRCAHCHNKVHVKGGATIPPCPHCGHETFDERVHEPGNKSS